MRRKYTLIIVSLLISLFIYLFYRTGHTVVNEIVIRLISLDNYLWLKSRIVTYLPLPDLVVYSLPEGLWVFCITLTSRPYHLHIFGRRLDCIYIPMVFCIGLELMQLVHITNGRFDFADIAVSFLFWMVGGFWLKDPSPKQNIFNRRDIRAGICLASYCIVYLAPRYQITMEMIRKHLKSYSYAFKGIALAFRHEPAMIFHLIAGLAVIITNILLKIDRTDWLITIILIGLAWMAEIFNTAIEKLADRVTKKQDPLIAQVKDLASGAVLHDLPICCFLRSYYLYPLSNRVADHNTANRSQASLIY